MIYFEIEYLLNRNSDENNVYMKVDQKNTMNPDTLFIYQQPPSNILNTRTSPSGSFADNHPELAVHPRMNSRSEQSI